MGEATQLSGIERLFWTEVKDPRATRRSLAVCYAMLISIGAGRGGEFWAPINEAVNARLGLSDFKKVDRWQRTPWQILEGVEAFEAPEAVRP